MKRNTVLAGLLALAFLLGTAVADPEEGQPDIRRSWTTTKQLEALEKSSDQARARFADMRMDLARSRATMARIEVERAKAEARFSREVEVTQYKIVSLHRRVLELQQAK